MKREYYRRVLFPVLSNYQVHIVVAEDIFEARKRRDKQFGHSRNLDRDCDAFHEPLPGGVSYLYFKLNSSSGDIAHECWHAVHRMFKWVGAELDNEMVAYHLGYLVDAVTRLYGNYGLNGVVKVKEKA